MERLEHLGTGTRVVIYVLEVVVCVPIDGVSKPARQLFCTAGIHPQWQCNLSVLHMSDRVCNVRWYKMCLSSEDFPIPFVHFPSRHLRVEHIRGPPCPPSPMSAVMQKGKVDTLKPFTCYLHRCMIVIYVKDDVERVKECPTHSLCKVHSCRQVTVTGQ